MSISARTKRPTIGPPETVLTRRLKTAGAVGERLRKEFLESSFRERGPVTRRTSAKVRTTPSQQNDENLSSQSKQEDEHSTSYSQSISPIKFPSSIEGVIVAFKAEATRRLRPAILESAVLKQQASPSVKQFLEIYDRPTAINKFTGKPVPLRQVYEKEIVQGKQQGTTLSSMNKVMGTIATQTEARAAVILMRKDPYNNALTGNFWSCDLPGLIADTPQTTTAVSLPKRKVLESRRSERNTRRKNHPVYLVAEGDARAQCPMDSTVITADEQSTKKWQRVHSSTPDSFFLTGVENYYDSFIKTPSKSLRFLGWQPLTKSALLEHTRVSEVPSVKKGTYLHNVHHRSHQLWKPQEAIMTHTSSSSSKVRNTPLQDVTASVSHYNNIGYSDGSNNFYRKYSNIYSHLFGFPSDL